MTFYMRKGADALSKWVGEAEKQLRLLFEEARKNQPSIIFFDEIDGLAPVRSSKQEQIHASIVATLLALMDGMDGRGQVIVIGATNRRTRSILPFAGLEDSIANSTFRCQTFKLVEPSSTLTQKAGSQHYSRPSKTSLPS